MPNKTTRSTVLYVWHNGKQSPAGLYRAVHPADLSKRPVGGFDGYFTIEGLNEFAAHLIKTHLDEDFVIRDWIADSAEDFYRTRLGWNDADIATHLPPHRRGSSADAPAPALLAGGVKWEMSRIEIQNNTIGLPVGIPIEKARVMSAMKAYRKNRNGPEMAVLGGDDGEIPMHWFRLSTGSRLGALKVFERFLDEDERRFERFVIPKSEEELYRALRENCGDLVQLRENESDGRYFFLAREEGDVLNEWWIGSHYDELVAAFGE